MTRQECSCTRRDDPKTTPIDHHAVTRRQPHQSPHSVAATGELGALRTRLQLCQRPVAPEHVAVFDHDGALQAVEGERGTGRG